MSELKTKPNDASVEAFIASLGDEKKRQDAQTLLELMTQATGHAPQMWGENIVGFGSYHYKYATGREGDWFLAGFSPRKQNLTLYIMSGFDQYEVLMPRLGKHSTGKACLYIKKLADIDLDVLRDLVQQSCAHLAKQS